MLIQLEHYVKFSLRYEIDGVGAVREKPCDAGGGGKASRSALFEGEGESLRDGDSDSAACSVMGVG